ncbi:hypothetical protein ONZ45_g1533 [Pleurotus djamor]|nr:hypothetical protein ONZ45_g1533 [Pleurotus djamor]
MTMAFASDDERLRYSQELAAYTLKQWTEARTSLDKQRAAGSDNDQRFMTPAELAIAHAKRKQQAKPIATRNDIDKSAAVKA